MLSCYFERLRRLRFGKVKVSIFCETTTVPYRQLYYAKTMLARFSDGLPHVRLVFGRFKTVFNDFGDQ